MSGKEMIFAVLGGDLRQVQVAYGLAKSGYKVKLFGFETYAEEFNGIEACSDLNQTMQNISCIILPLPYSVDGINLNAPYMKNPIKLNDIYSQIKTDMVVLGGKFNSYELNRRGIRTIDYFEREELQVLNAVPTAEGAIQIAMEERPFTIHGSRCLVVGFGRIGKVLASLLKGLNAEVTVTARKYEDLAWIRAYGYKHALTENIKDIVNEYDIVFNTVPAMVIGRNELMQARKETLFIDLASKPGGVTHQKGEAA
ncbi:MAG: shikimate/quinate 5-dehydrogenase [Clostridia bacterium]|nr:shikimate/quinate 5-dehydrogenase [Clostridia bacterium]